MSQPEYGPVYGQSRQCAEASKACAIDLMTGGRHNEPAVRLDLITDDGRNLGSWGAVVLTAIIARHMAALLEREMADLRAENMRLREQLAERMPR